jgi:hypothetical protein
MRSNGLGRERAATARPRFNKRTWGTYPFYLGVCGRPRAGCASFSALRIARAWPGPRRARRALAVSAEMSMLLMGHLNTHENLLWRVLATFRRKIARSE